jgi:hypothetical protein
MTCLDGSKRCCDRVLDVCRVQQSTNGFVHGRRDPPRAKLRVIALRARDHPDRTVLVFVDRTSSCLHPDSLIPDDESEVHARSQLDRSERHRSQLASRSQFVAGEAPGIWFPPLDKNISRIAEKWACKGPSDVLEGFGQLFSPPGAVAGAESDYRRLWALDCGVDRSAIHRSPFPKFGNEGLTNGARFRLFSPDPVFSGAAPPCLATSC